MRRTATILAVVGAMLALFAGAALAATIDGDGRDNKLVGTDRADTIRGLGGNDQVYGRGGVDTLSGGDGDDTVRGGDGDDTFEMRDGVAGNDAVRCGPGTQDVARVDSREEALSENFNCEAIVFEGQATGVVMQSDLCVPENCPEEPSYFIQDESDEGFYGLKSESVDFSAYEGRRVTAHGEVWARGACGGTMIVERVEEL